MTKISSEFVEKKTYHRIALISRKKEK